MTDGEWSPPEKHHWPTHAEVRQIVAIILESIAKSPDWTPKPPEKLGAGSPDENWEGWRKP
jgi:hypothetical protein